MARRSLTRFWSPTACRRFFLALRHAISPIWRGACACADAIEAEGLPGAVVGRGTVRRALGVAYFIERLVRERSPGRLTRDAIDWLARELARAGPHRADADEILRALRRHPDGALPALDKPGAPSRLERAIKMMRAARFEYIDATSPEGHHAARRPA